jgi:branched-chain amino acid transport system substrate-binding protein
MLSSHKILNILSAICLGLAWPAAARAQIVVGQTAGFSGTVASSVKETTEGAKLYFDAVNARGGVNGSQIQLVSLDDKFDPKLAVENARTLITQKNVLTLFLTRGTPHTQAIMPLLTEFKVPLVAPSTGAMVLHSPVHPWLFNVRATYQREAEKAIDHLSLIGMQRIAVVQVDDSFGTDAVAGAAKGFETTKLKPLFVEKFDRSKPDFNAIALRVAKAEAQAVLFIGSGSAIVDGLSAMRAAGSRAQIVTLSNNASVGFVKSLKENAHGTIVSQVFPNERSLKAPMVKEALDLATAKGIATVTPAMLEGFAGAKVLVEGLRRAGKNPTRSRLRDAMESMSKLDIGGLELGYGPTDHSGLNFSELSIVDADGQFKR